MVHKIQKGSTESITEKCVIKMCLSTPMPIVTDAALRQETVDMRIPFEIATKGMKDQNETGSEILGFVIFMKQTDDNTLDCLKKKTEKRSVF